MTDRRVRALVAFTVLTVLLSTGGCTGRSTGSSAPSSSTSSSGTPVANPCSNLRPATGPAAAKFGAAKVEAAECEMALFTLQGSFLPRLMQTGSFTKTDFAPFRAYMTPVARRAWDGDVAKLSTSGVHDKRALNAVLSITYVDVAGSAYTLGNSRTARSVSNRRLTSGRVRLVSVHGAPRLGLSLTMTFRFNLTRVKGGRSVAVEGRKVVGYTLTPNPGGPKDKPFLVDGWRGNSHFGAVKATG